MLGMNTCEAVGWLWTWVPMCWGLGPLGMTIVLLHRVLDTDVLAASDSADHI